MEKNIFEAAKKINSLIKQLPDDHELLDSLADAHSQMLRLDIYLNESEYINYETITQSTHDSLSVYTKVTVIYHYNNGYSLVEDTAGEIHYVPTSILK